jgi:hypothetical protein
LLGGGIEEQKSLETSVGNILTKQDQWDSVGAAKSMNKKKNLLNELRKERAA